MLRDYADLLLGSIAYWFNNFLLYHTLKGSLLLAPSKPPVQKPTGSNISPLISLFSSCCWGGRYGGKWGLTTLHTIPF